MKTEGRQENRGEVTENSEFGIKENDGLYLEKAARRHPEGPTERRATSKSLWGGFPKKSRATACPRKKGEAGRKYGHFDPKQRFPKGNKNIQQQSKDFLRKW